MFNAFTFIDNKILLSENEANRLTVLEDVCRLCIDYFPFMDVADLRIEWNMLLTHIHPDHLRAFRKLEKVEEF